MIVLTESWTAYLQNHMLAAIIIGLIALSIIADGLSGRNSD